MTQGQAEETVRDLVDRYGRAPWRMPDVDAARLAEAIEAIGQARVFAIAEDQCATGDSRYG